MQGRSKNIFDGLWLAITLGSKFESVKDAVLRFVGEGYSVGKVLPEIQSRLVHSVEIADSDKAPICLKLLEVDRCLNDGSNEQLQLLDVCCVVQDFFN